MGIEIREKTLGQRLYEAMQAEAGRLSWRFWLELCVGFVFVWEIVVARAHGPVGCVAERVGMVGGVARGAEAVCRSSGSGGEAWNQLIQGKLGTETKGEK
jgi:hypothetical protein